MSDFDSYTTYTTHKRVARTLEDAYAEAEKENDQLRAKNERLEEEINRERVHNARLEALVAEKQAKIIRLEEEVWLLDKIRNIVRNGGKMYDLRAALEDKEEKYE